MPVDVAEERAHVTRRAGSGLGSLTKRVLGAAQLCPGIKDNVT